MKTQEQPTGGRAAMSLRDHCGIRGGCQIGNGFETFFAAREFMKLVTMFLAPIVAMGIASIASARDYHDLVAEGYRWVKIDGPYACPTKVDLREITRVPSDLNELHMVEGIRAYYLIQGALVKIIQQDGGTGMAQIRVAGITVDLWTYNKFLSEHPIKDAYAVIETPETSGLNPFDISASTGTVQGATEAPMNSRRSPTNGILNAEQLRQPWAQ